MACVAAIIIGVALWFTFFSEDEVKTPKSEPVPTEPVAVYPEKGYTANVLVNKADKVTCDTKAVASIMLADSEGTVAHNGTKIKSTWDQGSVLVSFDGTAPYTSGYVVGADKTQPFNIPEELWDKSYPGITLSTTDFSEAGAFKDIYLCGGGM